MCIRDSYQTKVYSKAAETLGKVTTENDALTQNAYLHMGLSYLQLAEKNKARILFLTDGSRSNDSSLLDTLHTLYHILVVPHRKWVVGKIVDQLKGCLLYTSRCV